MIVSSCRVVAALFILMFAGHLAAADRALDDPGFNATGYWWLLQYPALFHPPQECCGDFDGDELDDDALGAAAALQASLSGLDANGDMVVGFETGVFVPLIDWLEIPVPGQAGPVSLQIFDGSWLGPEGFDTRRAGLGWFQLDLDNQDAVAGMLTGQAAVDGTLQLTGDQLTLPFLFGPTGQIMATLSEVSVEGQVSWSVPHCIGICSVDSPGNEPAVLGGLEIAGVLTLDSYFGALDGAYRQCSCAGIDPDQTVITFGENLNTNGYDVNCTGNTGTPGNCSNGCEALTDFCQFITLQPLLADYDSNENSINDAFTVGLRAAIAGANIGRCLGEACPESINGFFSDSFEGRADGTEYNHPPEIQDQVLSVDENSPNTTMVGTVVAADSDTTAPNNALGFAIIGGNGATAFMINPVNGEVSVADQSLLDFETHEDFSMTVMVSDGGTPRGVDTAEVTVELNDLNEPPVAYEKMFDTDEDTALVANAISGGDGEEADGDPDAGDEVRVVEVNGSAANVGPLSTLPDGSTLEIASDGIFTFTPGPTYQALPEGGAAQTSFSYTISDLDGETDTATVFIDIAGLNDAPTFTTTVALQSALTGGSYDYTMPPGLVIDIDGDPLTLTSELVDGSVLPTWLTFTANSGNFAGIPAAGDRTLQFIRITATDPYLASDELVYPLAIVDELVNGTAGADSLVVSGNVSQLSTGLEENDFHIMSDGGDIYHYRAGDGVDVIDDNGFHDTDWLFMEGYSPGDASFSRFANDYDDLSINLPNGDRVIVMNALNGSASDTIERVAFDGGTFLTMPEIAQLILGQAQTGGDDSVTGFASAETFNAGPGDDAVSGRDGSDIYVYAVGDGADVIRDGGFSDTDEIHISGYAFTDASFMQIPGGVDIEVDFGGGDSIRIVNSLEENSTDRIEWIRFLNPAADVSMSDLRDQFIADRQTDGDDSVIGYQFAETLQGGEGNDLMRGEDGSDLYRYAAGDGADVIHDDGFQDNDVLEITGYGFGDAVFRQVPGSTDFIIDFGNGDSVRIVDSLNGSSTNQLESIHFLVPDKTMNMADVRALIIRQQSSTGDDYIAGFTLPDTIEGGTGMDVMLGGEGSDDYTYNAGDGVDIINDLGFQDTDRLTIAGHNAADASLITTDAYPGDVILEFTADQSVTILHGLSGNYLIEEIIFDDVTWLLADLNTAVTNTGTTYSIVAGTANPDIIDASPGAEVLRGLASGDTYRYQAGDGLAIIDDNGNGSGDVLELTGYSEGDATFSREPGREDSDLRIDLGVGDRIVVKNGLNYNFSDAIETIQFTGDGFSLDLAGIHAEMIVQDQDDGDDSVIGFNRDDILDAGAGIHYLSGRDDSDTYLYTTGDGEVHIDDNGAGDQDLLQVTGYLSSQASFSRATGYTNDLVIRFSATDSLRLVNSLNNNFTDTVEQVQFVDDGVTWTIADVRARLVTSYKTDDDDVISGFGLVDTMDGGLGDDFLFGGSSSDVYLFKAGYGRDTIEDNGDGDVDVLRISDYLPGDASLSRATGDADDLVITFSATDSIHIVNTLNGAFGDAIEQIEFEDDPLATTWSMADVREMLLAPLVRAGDDRIVGFTTADVLTGGGGDDLIIGLQGIDAYEFFAGDGSVTIQESGSFEDDTLTIHGHLSTDASFRRLVPGADDFLISFANGDNILLVNTWSGSESGNTVDFVTFSQDAVTLTMADIEAMVGL